MTVLIKDILNFAQLQSGKYRLEAEEFALVEDVLVPAWRMLHSGPEGRSKPGATRSAPAAVLAAKRKGEPVCVLRRCPDGVHCGRGSPVASHQRQDEAHSGAVGSTRPGRRRDPADDPVHDAPPPPLRRRQLMWSCLRQERFLDLLFAGRMLEVSLRLLSPMFDISSLILTPPVPLHRGRADSDEHTSELTQSAASSSRDAGRRVFFLLQHRLVASSAQLSISFAMSSSSL